MFSASLLLHFAPYSFRWHDDGLTCPSYCPHQDLLNSDFASENSLRGLKIEYLDLKPFSWQCIAYLTGNLAEYRGDIAT